MFKKLSVYLLFLLSVAVCLQPTARAYEDTALNWYCPKINSNGQLVADAPMRVVEKYQGYYVDRKCQKNDSEKVVYLTFDAGYENGNITKILDILREEKVNGAFFVLGNLIQKEPELMIRMAEEGHLVCNHTFHHKDMTKIDNSNEFLQELSSLESLYYETTGKQMAKYYRPPEGKFDERSLRFASELGYKTIFWSVAYADWDNQKQPSRELAMKKLLGRIHNGAVILLHPTSRTNAEILGEVIQTLKAQGYRFGSLDELTAE